MAAIELARSQFAFTIGPHIVMTAFFDRPRQLPDGARSAATVERPAGLHRRLQLLAQAVRAHFCGRRSVRHRESIMRKAKYIAKSLSMRPNCKWQPRFATNADWRNCNATTG